MKRLDEFGERRVDGKEECLCNYRHRIGQGKKKFKNNDRASKRIPGSSNCSAPYGKELQCTLNLISKGSTNNFIEELLVHRTFECWY